MHGTMNIKFSGMGFLVFSTNLCVIFLIPRIIQRDKIINVYRTPCKVPINFADLFMKFKYSR